MVGCKDDNALFENTDVEELRKISVIVPVYKTEKYVTRCIRSILNQTYQNLEVILIDDGSPDRGGEICDDYARQDPRIMVIHQENGGVSSARNAGLEKATGRYVTFIDSDDWIKSDFLRTLIQYDGCDLIACSAELSYYIRGLSEKFRTVDRKLIKDQISSYFSNGLDCWQMVPWGKLFRMDIIRDNQLQFDESLHYSEDSLFNIQYLYYCKSVSTLSYIGYTYSIYPTIQPKYDNSVSEIARCFAIVQPEMDKLCTRFKLRSYPLTYFLLMYPMDRILKIKTDDDYCRLYTQITLKNADDLYNDVKLSPIFLTIAYIKDNYYKRLYFWGGSKKLYVFHNIFCNKLNGIDCPYKGIKLIILLMRKRQIILAHLVLCLYGIFHKCTR